MSSKFEKPQLSYITMIGGAILDSGHKRLLLGDIYEYIQDKWPYFRDTKEKSWRNAVRHNLSLNECFIKVGRTDNGKGNYWAIHPACYDGFSAGDFTRKKARNSVKEYEGAYRRRLVVNYPGCYACMNCWCRNATVPEVNVKLSDNPMESSSLRSLNSLSVAGGDEFILDSSKSESTRTGVAYDVWGARTNTNGCAPVSLETADSTRRFIDWLHMYSISRSHGDTNSPGMWRPWK